MTIHGYISKIQALRDKKVLQALVVDSKDSPGYDVRI